MKTSLDLRKRPADLAGEPLGTETLAQIAATAVMQSNEGPAVKLYAIAQELFRSGTANLDRADIEVVRQAIDSSKMLINLAKAQILEVCDDALAKLRTEKKDEA